MKYIKRAAAPLALILSASAADAGGGGGYSGGGGGFFTAGGYGAGAGGGSFDSGIDQILVADDWSGNGEVELIDLGSDFVESDPVPEPGLAWLAALPLAFVGSIFRQKAILRYAIPALALLSAAPAFATPVTWDYTVSSCSPIDDGSCGSSIIGSTFATFTVTPPETNDYEYTTFGPFYTAGADDFSLTVDGFTTPTDGNTCGSPNCGWTVDYDATAASPGITNVSFSDGIDQITYKAGAWTVYDGLYGQTLAGSWSDPNQMQISSVPEPSSLMLFATCLGMTIIGWRILARWRV